MDSLELYIQRYVKLINSHCAVARHNVFLHDIAKCLTLLHFYNLNRLLRAQY